MGPDETRTPQPAPSKLRRETWNAATIDELRGLQEPGKPDLVDELVGVFDHEVHPLLAKLNGHVTRREREAVHALAHRIKGSALNLGAEKLGRAAGELERAAVRGDTALFEALMSEVTREYSRFLARTPRA